MVMETSWFGLKNVIGQGWKDCFATQQQLDSTPAFFSEITSNSRGLEGLGLENKHI